jgi:hypothetical protein
MRKIGYSVGLEFLVSRVADVLSVFMAGALDGASWRDLVRQQWNRQSPAAEQHIADVYAQLEVLRRQNNSIQPLPALEAMAVIARGTNPLTDAVPMDAGLSAIRNIMLLKVIEADGDIFLNALAARFDPTALERRLKSLVRHKRRTVAPHFRQAASIRRLSAAISIRNQTEGPNKSGPGGRKLTYAERSRMLMASRETPSSRDWADQDIPLSQDYLEKACVTRCGWAEDFELYQRSGGTSEAGERLLGVMSDLGLSQSDDDGDFYFLWPYPFQLARMNLRPDDLGAKVISPWEVASAVAGVIAATVDADPSKDKSADYGRGLMLTLLAEAMRRYRGSGRRGVLRHELPLFIAEPVLAWWFAEAGRPLPDFKAFICEELQRPDRGLDQVMIYGTEGGLRLMAGEA